MPKLIPSYYCNAGAMDKTLQAYIPDSQSTVRPQVMRNGVMVDIKAHNAQIYLTKRMNNKRKGKA